MSQVEIYSSIFCGFCFRAKKLLEHKGVEFEEIDVTLHPKRRQEMRDRANGDHKVPQIFIADQHIGGCQELYELEARGELDQMLQGSA